MTTETREVNAQETFGGEAGPSIHDAQPTPQAQAAPTDATAQTAQQDWQKKYEEAEARLKDATAQLAKLESDLKAAKGRAKPVETLGAQISALQEELAGLRQGLLVLGKAIDSGETGKVASEIQELSQQVAGRSLMTRLHNQAMEALEQAAMGDDGQPLFDINTVPELNDIRIEYNEALRERNPMALSLALAKAVPVINRLRVKVGEEKMNKKMQDAIKAVEAKAAAEIEKTKRSLGVLTVPVSGAGAPASGLPRATKENIDQLWMQWEREHPNEANPYSDQYRKFLATGEV